MILATDLDGTFLGGDEAEQRTLYSVLRREADHTLIFATGRGLESVLPLLDDPIVPDPHYVIADVGATVVRGRTLEPVQPLQTRIAQRWPGTHRVLDALSRFDFLRRQEVPQVRRCSFFATSDEIDAELRRVVRDLGCELLLSGGRYLDILPRGVSKGATLRALLETEELDPDSVVVAGDTLNDLSLFQCGLKGIVVGDAEAELRERIERDEYRARTYVALRAGAGGILEGLEHFELIEDEESVRRESPGAAASQLVMVYHRLPFEEVERDGEVRRLRPKSPNGIIPTLLGFFATGRSGSWVAWSKQPTREPADFEPRVPVNPDLYPRLTAARIPLTADDVRLFYETFSKEAFWPVIFSFPDRSVFREEHWQHYLEVNRLFAERTAKEAERGALVWIHDYNLWMVPAFLRNLRPDLRIAFFHHTAFPASDIFNLIPWRREIASSLLQCDYVGFHIPRYAENFADVIRSHAPCEVLERASCAPRFMTFGCALGVDTMPTRIQAGERTVRLGAHPVGIDVAAIEEILTRPAIRKKMDAIRAQIGDRQCILSVERLDYVKGPLEKLRAFETMLERHPELHGRVVLLTVCTPPAPGMKVYREIRERVDEAVGRINGRFSKLDWVPVRYFFRSLPFEEVIAHYAVSDIAWITPLRDGLNLVAKEYVAANSALSGDGVLVLSEFAGAAVELHGAVLTNPYHGDSLAESLRRSLDMPAEERRARMQGLHDIVRANDIASWGREFLEAANGD